MYLHFPNYQTFREKRIDCKPQYYYFVNDEIYCYTEQQYQPEIGEEITVQQFEQILPSSLERTLISVSSNSISLGQTVTFSIVVKNGNGIVNTTVTTRGTIINNDTRERTQVLLNIFEGEGTLSFTPEQTGNYVLSVRQVPGLPLPGDLTVEVI